MPVAPTADAGLIARRLRMAAAWAGQVTAGAYQAGDGTASATVELVGEHATVTLSLLVNRVDRRAPPGRRDPLTAADARAGKLLPDCFQE